MVSQNSERAVNAAPEADDPQDKFFAEEQKLSSADTVTTDEYSSSITKPLDAEDVGPEVGPGRRATDAPVSAPAKSLQHLALAGMIIGLAAGFIMVSSDSLNRFLGLGLTFFAGGLAVWRLFADDMQRSVQALQVKDDKIRRLMARCEELEDRAWELGESDERHASILATLGDVVVRRDQDGTITYVNSAADDVFGLGHALQP
ncbi:MAG: PAS domain-containing sensor histidine kinase, partial [Pseudomonadota bacterium]|nr:PAS domain-containing sensor histidine kinase [Pseudomonadota bacterium]